MRTRVMLTVLVLALLALFLARWLRPVNQPLTQNEPPVRTPQERATDSAAPQREGPTVRGAEPATKTPGQPGRSPGAQPSSREAGQMPWPLEPLPPGSNLQEQLEEFARRKGVPLNVLTQQAIVVMSNAFSEALNGPIDFYGQALDEQGTPLAGASAVISCLSFPEKQLMTNVTTDAKGQFVLRGLSGQALTVRLSKEGFDEVPGANEHDFFYRGAPKPFQPDPHNPVVFVFRKKE